MPLLGVGCVRPADLRGRRRDLHVTPYETRLVELLERLDATLQEVREHLDRGRRQAAADPSKAIEAFADEAFRDRDA